MTLDEAIKHCEEKAKEQREKATAIARAKEPFYKYAECAECAKEHEQLAEWLKELKAYKERPQGKWKITDSYPHKVYCDKCFKTYAQANWEVWKDGTLAREFCPNCGADMRKGGAE